MSKYTETMTTPTGKKIIEQTNRVYSHSKFFKIKGKGDGDYRNPDGSYTHRKKAADGVYTLHVKKSEE